MVFQPIQLLLVVSILVNVVLIVALILVERQNQRRRTEDRERQNQERERHTRDREAWQQALKNSQRQAKELTDLNDKALAEIKQLTAFYARTEAYFREKQREEWLVARQCICYNGTADVNARFVYPLLLLLGYEDGQFLHNREIHWTSNTGVPQKLKVDWTIYQSTARQPDRLSFFVYTVDSSRAICADDVEEAAHRAVGLQSGLGMITNGLQLQIYKLEVTQRDLLFDFPVADLTFRWQQLDDIIGVAKLTGAP